MVLATWRFLFSHCKYFKVNVIYLYKLTKQTELNWDPCIAALRTDFAVKKNGFWKKKKRFWGSFTRKSGICSLILMRTIKTLCMHIYHIKSLLFWEWRSFSRCSTLWQDAVAAEMSLHRFPVGHWETKKASFVSPNMCIFLFILSRRMTSSCQKKL